MISHKREKNPFFVISAECKRRGPRACGKKRSWPSPVPFAKMIMMPGEQVEQAQARRMLAG